MTQRKLIKQKKRIKDYKKKKNIINQWLDRAKSLLERGIKPKGCCVKFPKRKITKKSRIS